MADCLTHMHIIGLSQRIPKEMFQTTYQNNSNQAILNLNTIL